MQLTVDIPEEMVPRLRPHEKRLTRVLELGLEALEASGSGSGAEASEEAALQQAASAFTERALDDDEEPLTPEELVAYAEERLGKAERAELEERLALEPEAVDELLDYHHFETLEPPSRDLALSDDDVRSALGELRGSIAAEKPRAESPTSASANGPGPVSIVRRLQKQLPYLALAASLVLALGSFLMVQGEQDEVMVAKNVQFFELLGKKGEPWRFDLEEESDWFQLTLPRIPSLEGKHGEIVLSLNGQTILRSSIQGQAAEGTRVVISDLPKKRFGIGSYKIEILDAEGLLLETLEFSVERPPVFGPD